MTSMTERTNIERAADAMVAVERYVAADLGDPGDLRTSIVDLVTDLLHLAASRDFDAVAVADIAKRNWAAEQYRARPTT